MFDWLVHKPKKQLKLKPVKEGDVNLTVDLPSHYKIKQEENTTAAYDPSFKGAVARYTCIYISNDRMPNAHGLGLRGVQDTAKKYNTTVIQYGNKYFVTYREPSRQENEKANVQFWHTALDNSILITSCWISQATEDTPKSKSFVESIHSSILSLRPSKVQIFTPEGDEKQEVFELSLEHNDQLKSWREIARKSAEAICNTHRFIGEINDLHIIQDVLDHMNFDRNNIQVVEGLGVILGDVLAKKLDLHWVTIKDNIGTTPALRYKDSGIYLYAKDLLAKRIERHEPIDVGYLFNTLIDLVHQEIKSSSN